MAMGALLGLPILLFVHRYIDDYGRSMDGEFRWAEVGRPLAEALFWLLNFGTPATAVAPLHQLLAIAILAFTGAVAARAYGVRSPLWTAVATAPLIAQPYFLENLSYGFDSLAMAVALALPVLAAVLVERVASWAAVRTAVGLLVASLACYQPGFNGFLPFALLLGLARTFGLAEAAGKQTQRFRWLMLRVFCSAFLALALYRLILMITFRSPTSYAINQGRLLPLDFSLAEGLLANAASFWGVIFDDWNGWPVAGVLVFWLLAYALSVWRALGRKAGRSLAKRIRACGGLIAGVAAVGFFSPGLLLFLEDPLVNVPRVLVFLGPLLCSINLQMVWGFPRLGSIQCFERTLRVVAPAAVASLGWLLVVVSYAYGHASAAQSIFEQSRLVNLVGGISRLRSRQQSPWPGKVLFIGEMLRSPVLSNTRRKFPLIGRLVPRLINNDWAWGRKQLLFHGVDLEQSRLQPDEIPAADCADPQSAECSTDFALQIAGDTVVVRMNH